MRPFTIFEIKKSFIYSYFNLNDRPHLILNIQNILSRHVKTDNVGTGSSVRVWAACLIGS